MHMRGCGFIDSAQIIIYESHETNKIQLVTAGSAREWDIPTCTGLRGGVTGEGDRRSGGKTGRKPGNGSVMENRSCRQVQGLRTEAHP